MLSAEPSHDGEEGEGDRGGVASHSVVDVPLSTVSHHQRNETQKKSSSRTDFQCFHHVVNNDDVGGLVRASTGQSTGEKPAASLAWASFTSQNRQPSDEKKSSELSLGLVPPLYAGKGRSEVRDTTANERIIPPIQVPSPTCTIMPTTSENSRSGDLDQKTSPFTSTQPLDTTTTLPSTPSADPSSALHPTNSPTFLLTTPSPLNHTDSLVRDTSLTSTTLVYDSQRNNIGSTTNGDVALGSTRPGAEKDAPTHSFPSSSCPDGFSEGTNPPPMPPLTTEIQHNGASSVPAACMLPVPPTSLNLAANKSQKKAPNTQEVTRSLSFISERDQFSSLTAPRSTTQTQTLVSSESNSRKRKPAPVANDDAQQPSSNDSDEASDSNAHRESLPIQLRNKKMKSTDCLLFAATLLEQDTTDPAPESKGRPVGNGVDKSLQLDQDSSSLAATNLPKAKKKNPDPRTLASVAAQVPPASKDGGAKGENITKPRDVLCGRGGLINKHPGNIAYRKIVDYNKPYYQSVQKKHRILVSQSIVQTILNNGGRFLILGSRGGTWMEIGFKRAVQKTSQALRERTSAPDEGQQEDADEGGDGTMESGHEQSDEDE